MKVFKTCLLNFLQRSAGVEVAGFSSSEPCQYFATYAALIVKESSRVTGQTSTIRGRGRSQNKQIQARRPALLTWHRRTWYLYVFMFAFH